MNQNIIFKGIGTYHPAGQKDNSYYVKHFEDLGVEVSGLVNHLGRNIRCIADIEKENVITMAYEASVKALKSENVGPEEIDLIIFGTESPEKLVPTNALLLHDKLKTTNSNQIFDMNSNCTGMLTAIDVASRLLMSNPRMNKALVVGSFMGSLIASATDPVCYSNLADAAVAIILEKVDEPQKRGFIDTNFKTDPVVKDTFQFPVCGFTNMYNAAVNIEDKKLKLNPFDTSFICKEWVGLMDVLFNRYDISKHAIKQYFFSQFSRPDAETTLAMMGLNLDKFTYIGDKYGYTGLTSPLLAFNEALINDTIHTGDYIMFCTVGAGYNICALLYKL